MVLRFNKKGDKGKQSNKANDKGKQSNKANDKGKQSNKANDKGKAKIKQKTAYEISACLVGSEMCIRDRYHRL